MLNAAKLMNALSNIAHDSESVYETSQMMAKSRVSMTDSERLRAFGDLDYDCSVLAARVVHLWSDIAKFDEDLADGELRSFAELGLRAQVLAVLFILDDLNDEMCCSPLRYSALFCGGYRNIADLVSLVFGSLAHISRLWVRRANFASAIPAGRGFVSPAQRASYFAEIRRAQQEMAILALHPALEHFVNYGKVLPREPTINNACTLLAAVLRTSLTRELEPGLFLANALFGVRWGPRCFRCLARKNASGVVMSREDVSADDDTEWCMRHA